MTHEVVALETGYVAKNNCSIDVKQLSNCYSIVDEDEFKNLFTSSFGRLKGGVVDAPKFSVESLRNDGEEHSDFSDGGGT